MLAHTYRFRAKNNTGVTIPAGKITIKARRWKFASNSNDKVDESSETSVYSNGNSIADGNSEAGSTIDNSSDKWLGGDFMVEVDATGLSSPDGDVTIYYEVSTDGGTKWPDADKGHLACAINVTSAAVYRRAFSL